MLSIKVLLQVLWRQHLRTLNPKTLRALSSGLYNLNPKTNSTWILRNLHFSGVPWYDFFTEVLKKAGYLGLRQALGSSYMGLPT